MPTKVSQEDRDASIAQLRDWLKPGDTVYTILRSVSKSGMSRVISCRIFLNGDATNPRILDYHIARAVGYTHDREREGLKVHGCGMDMGFDVVYNLGRVLWPEGFKVEGRGRNGDTSGWDNDGGYALKQRWL